MKNPTVYLRYTEKTKWAVGFDRYMKRCTLVEHSCNYDIDQPMVAVRFENEFQPTFVYTFYLDLE